MDPNPLLETPPNAAAIEYKKGYVMRKCCFDANNKKSKWTLLKYLPPAPSPSKVRNN